MKIEAFYEFAVLVDTSTDWGRRLIKGVLGLVHERMPIHIWVEPRGRSETLRLPEGWNGDGVIARVSDLDMALHLEAAGIPVVNISRIQIPEAPDFPRVTVDSYSSAHLAFDHFRSRGFVNFAYVEPAGHPYLHDHYVSFADILRSEGMDCHLYSPGEEVVRGADWESQLANIIAWMQGIPKPLAVYTWDSEVGRFVIDACMRAGISVPHEVAVLGGDDDDLLCDASLPSLSGVRAPASEIGNKAAEILIDIINKKEVESPILLNSQDISVRASTDTLATSDPALIKSIQFIRDHIAEPITVKDLLRVVPMARRTLEKKFKQAFGRTPSAELQALRISRARFLLANTNLPMQDIAESCGFSNYNYLCYIFKKNTGASPAAYRKLARFAKY